MDDKDKELMKIMQQGFPVTQEPFQALGDKLWIDGMGVISRLVRLSQSGVIRYFGAFFNSRNLGYKGTLAALNVPAGRLDEVAAVINEFPQVTHNYLRDGEPNLWFTIIARNEAELNKIVDSIKSKGKVETVLLFPATKMFKVRTDLS